MLKGTKQQLVDNNHMPKDGLLLHLEQQLMLKVKVLKLLVKHHMLKVLVQQQVDNIHMLVV
jgi:hypothetical protein